jgi:hypothetical protein
MVTLSPLAQETQVCPGQKQMFLSVLAIYQQDMGDWSRKKWGVYWILLNNHFNEAYYCFYKLLLHREHLVRKSMPSIRCQGYISTGKHS